MVCVCVCVCECCNLMALYFAAHGCHACVRVKMNPMQTVLLSIKMSQPSDL